MKVELTELQLRWIIDQLETSFEEGHLSASETETMKTLRNALQTKGKRK